MIDADLLRFGRRRCDTRLRHASRAMTMIMRYIDDDVVMKMRAHSYVCDSVRAFVFACWCPPSESASPTAADEGG
ncbi:hypothetical protein N9L68_01645 [bacterium]|nr:hypothetical protein [bacterium]